jgi:hypothetical protein
MSKREPDTKPSEARANTNQRLPGGHFDKDGLSQGDMIGEGRKTHDAYQGERAKDGERK